MPHRLAKTQGGDHFPRFSQPLLDFTMSADSLLASLENAVQAGNIADGNACLAKVKIALLESPDPAKMCAALECGVLLAVAEGDLEAFGRQMGQLQPLYDVVQSSPRQSHALGLNLMFLLVQNRLSEFHSQLEVIQQQPGVSVNDPLISFPISLERHLMVGMYDELLKSQAPHPSFQLFVDELLSTVRDDIGDALETAYTSISVQDAAQMMKFQSSQEFMDYLSEARPDWIIQDGVLTFAPPETSLELPSDQWIEQSIAYATEMERIV